MSPKPEIKNLTPDIQNQKPETVEVSAPGAERRALAAGAHAVLRAYRGTSLIRKRTNLRPYRRHMPRVLGDS